MSALSIVAWAIAAVYALHCGLLIYAASTASGVYAARLKFVTLVPFNVAVTWFSLITAPVTALFVQRNGWLPWWLKWVSTHDEWLYGLSTQIGREPMPITWLQRYLTAARWIRRNPAYHFAHHVCGYRQARQIAGSNRDVQDAKLIVGGQEVQTLDVADRLVGIYAYAPWGDAFFVTADIPLGFKTLRIGAGWKLWRNTPQGSTDQRASDPDGVSMMATKIGFIENV